MIIMIMLVIMIMIMIMILSIFYIIKLFSCWFLQNISKTILSELPSLTHKWSCV